MMNKIAKMALAALLSVPALAVGADNPGNWPKPPKVTPAADKPAQLAVPRVIRDKHVL